MCLHLLNLVQGVVVCGHTSVVDLLEADNNRVADAGLVDGHNLAGVLEPVGLGPQDLHLGAALGADLGLRGGGSGRLLGADGEASAGSCIRNRQRTEVSIGEVFRGPEVQLRMP